MTARRGLWLRLAGAAAGGVLLLTLAAVLTVSHYEEADPFCASCHTVPEVTYFDRVQEEKAATGVYAARSSAHYGADNGFRCIDCHRGNEGVFHRIAALSLVPVVRAAQ